MRSGAAIRPERPDAAWLSRPLKNYLRCQYGVFSEVRGLGLLLGCVLSDAWKGKAKAVLDAAAAEGLLVLQASPDVVRFAPSLVVEDSDIDEGLARFERGVAKLTQA